MNNQNKLIIKTVLVYSFFLVQFYRLVKSGNTDFEYIAFQSTIGKYSLCIFFGYMTLFFDNDILKSSWNDLVIIRSKSRIRWCFNSLIRVFFRQLGSAVTIALLLFLSGITYGINCLHTKNTMLYCGILFVYLLLVNYLVILMMSVTRRPAVSLGFGAVINTAFLAITHYYLDIQNNMHEVLFAQIVLLIIVLCLCFVSMITFDIYTNRNASFIF